MDEETYNLEVTICENDTLLVILKEYKKEHKDRMNHYNKCMIENLISKLEFIDESN